MRRLTVLYDPKCALCQRAWIWLNAQRQYVRLEFLPAGSDLARSRFPDLDHEAALRELTVIGDGGEVYLGVKAWLMCLWALRDYRAMALRWSAPDRMELARRFVAFVSHNRRSLNGVLSVGRSR
jgi:predicted DCC family thiol-disulfide oxidoreductase YuxK